MKRILAAIVVVVFLLVLIPFVDGYLFKSHFFDLLAAMRNDQGAKITVDEYHQGWFSSEAKLSTTVDYGNFPVKFTLVQHISHGPLVFDPIKNHWTFALAAVQSVLHIPPRAEVMLFGNELGAMQINSLASFGKQFQHNIKIPAVVFGLPGLGKLNWQGLDGNIYVQIADQHIQNIKSDWTLGQLSVQSDEASLFMQNTTLQSEIIRHAVGLWYGSSSITVPGISLTSLTDSKVYSIKDLNESHQLSIEGNDFYNIETNISLNKLIVPDFSIDASNIKILLNHLSVTGIKTVSQTLSTILNSTVALTPQQEMLVRDKLPLLLTPSSQISEIINVNTSAGKFHSDGKFYWPVMVKTWMDLDKVNFQINVRVSISLINKCIELAAQSGAMAPPPTTPATIDTTQGNEEGLLDLIDKFAEDDKISLSISLQLKDIVRIHPTTDVFANDVDEFVLKQEFTADVATALKDKYNQIYPTFANQDASLSTPAPAPAPQQVAPQDQVKQQIDTLVKQGYLKIDKADYVLQIVRDQTGVVKVNGLDITPALAGIQEMGNPPPAPVNTTISQPVDQPITTAPSAPSPMPSNPTGTPVPTAAPAPVVTVPSTTTPAPVAEVPAAAPAPVPAPAATAPTTAPAPVTTEVPTTSTMAPMPTTAPTPAAAPTPNTIGP